MPVPPLAVRVVPEFKLTAVPTLSTSIFLAVVIPPLKLTVCAFWRNRPVPDVAVDVITPVKVMVSSVPVPSTVMLPAFNVLLTVKVLPPPLVSTLMSRIFVVLLFKVTACNVIALEAFNSSSVIAVESVMLP